MTTVLSRQTFLSDYTVTHDTSIVEKFMEGVTTLSIDLETTGLDFISDTLLLCGLYAKGNYLIIDCTTIDINIIKPYLESEEITKIGHNLKFDYKFLRKHGIRMVHMYDTMLAEQLIYAGFMDRKYNLADVLSQYKVYLNKTHVVSFIGRTSFIITDKDIAYLIGDLKYLENLRDKQLLRLRRSDSTYVVYLENKALEAFSEMEYNGMYLNATYWQEEIITPLESQIKQLETDLDKELIRLLPQFEVVRSKDLFGGEGILTHTTKKKIQFSDRYTTVNWNSPAQKLKILQSLNIDTTASTGSDSVGDEVLQRNKSHPLVALLITYSEASKILSSFGKSLLQKIHPTTLRIHPEFKQLGTATGRVSCTNPNLQQIPSGKKYRQGFQAPDNYQITATDYSGMELRILADLSGDPTFIEAFNNGEDLHSKIASKMFNVEVSKSVNKHLRDRQKQISFGLSYGASEHKFKDMFDGDLDKAKEVLGLFFSMFPSIKSYLDSSGKSAVSNLYSVTPAPYKRRRWYPKLKYADTYELHRIKGEVEREGKNAVIQGCNADITKAALYKIHRYIIDNNLDAKLICTVHDEILVEHHKDIDMKPIMEGIMIKEAEVVLKRVKIEAESSTDYFWVH